jgi:transposase
MVETTKQHYADTGKFLFKYDLTMQFKGRGGDHVPATTMQTLADRLDKALRRYLAFKEQGLPCGFPRFKTPNRWHSIQLRQYAQSRNVWLDADEKHLHVPAKLGLLLKINGMLANHHLAKGIADASWGLFIDILTDKAARAGHQVIQVPARFTSQKCHRCREIVQKSLSVRTHICTSCGYVEDRDVNAAKNILQAGAPPSGTVRETGPDELRSPSL